jgi:ribosomal protein S18 acetylase RimI-like enzyme
MARGLRSAWLRQARYVEGGSSKRIDGLILSLTNLPEDSLNVVLVGRAPGDAAAALRRAEEFFVRRGRRLGVDLPAGRYRDVEEAASAMGFRPYESRPGMALPLDGFAALPPQPGVIVRPVRDEADRLEFVRIQSEVFGLKRDVADRFLPAAAMATRGVRFYLGLWGGSPAGAAIAHVDHGAVGIFGVATLPWARRRGVATAMTSAALLDAREAADLAWLQSTASGRHVYERMGFRRVGEWVVWARPR